MSLHDMKDTIDGLTPEERAYFWHTERDLDELEAPVRKSLFDTLLLFGIGFAWGAVVVGAAWWVHG